MKKVGKGEVTIILPNTEEPFIEFPPFDGGLVKSGLVGYIETAISI